MRALEGMPGIQVSLTSRKPLVRIIRNLSYGDIDGVIGMPATANQKITNTGDVFKVKGKTI